MPNEQKPSFDPRSREFQAAVAEAAALAVENALKQMPVGLAAGLRSAGGDDAGLVERLALAIAEISDQGTSRKRVAPEILAERAKAHERCVQLILKARKDGESPEYRLISKVYINERLIDPFTMGPDKKPIPTEISYTGMPGDAMRPLNAVAKRIYAEYRASVGTPEKLSGVREHPLWMTPGGVVVKGDPPARRAVAAAETPFVDDLNIKTQNDPTAPFVHVLGTVAAPARQNYAGAS